MIINYKIIGKRIKELRRKHGLTQEKLAEMCNSSASYISLIESANRTPSLDLLINLANNLGITVDNFLKGYQINDKSTYQYELISLIEDCSCVEKQIIYEIATTTKKSLRDNNYLYYMSKF